MKELIAAIIGAVLAIAGSALTAWGKLERTDVRVSAMEQVLQKHIEFHELHMREIEEKMNTHLNNIERQLFQLVGENQARKELERR